MQVELDITHPFIGDLRVALTAPSGREAVLQDREGGSRDNLIASFASSETPALQALAGEEMQGRWVLGRTSDQAGRDVGKLNRWAVALER